jgi:hypothetical protein
VLVIAGYKSFDTGLRSAEGQKVECFKGTVNNIFVSTMNIIFTIHLKHSTFCPSADVKPMSNDL